MLTQIPDNRDGEINAVFFGVNLSVTLFVERFPLET
jgi:hypothetical protein